MITNKKVRLLFILMFLLAMMVACESTEAIEKVENEEEKSIEEIEAIFEISVIYDGLDGKVVLDPNEKVEEDEAIEDDEDNLLEESVATNESVDNQTRDTSNTNKSNSGSQGSSGNSGGTTNNSTDSKNENETRTKNPKPEHEPEPELEPKPEPVKEIAITDLFQMWSGTALSSEQRRNAHNDTMANPQTSYYVDQLNREYNKYINGTFNWDYRNKNNRNNYLAFRGGNYRYDNTSMNASQQYNAIHKKIEEHQFVIESRFSYSKEDIYIHPTEGGYYVSGVLQIRYTSHNGSKIIGWNERQWYSVRYETEWTFKTTNSSDNWNFWSYGDYGLLLLSREVRTGSFR